MREKRHHYLFIIIILLVSQILFSCNAKEEKTSQVEPPIQPQQVLPQSPKAQDANPSGSLNVSADRIAAQSVPVASSGVVIDVNGKKLMRERLDDEVKKAMKAMKDQIPADKKKEYEQNLRKRIVDSFVSRTLLGEEIERKKISVSAQELTDEINKIKSSLPKGVTMEDLMKKNNISKEKMNEDIRFSILVNKLVTSSTKEKLKATDKDIENFYSKNKEKFKRPETAHARHILIAKAAGDDDKIKSEKKAKAESIRKQLLDGADFAQLALQNSDCPSKQNGGDLGVFAKGQMVKPFEDAAYSQKIMEIGPVVETNFGYHIIQVLERKQAQPMDLDDPLKKRIATFVEQQKLQRAFANLIKNLQTKAKIIAYEIF